MKRITARTLIFDGTKLLVFYRRRLDLKPSIWLEYFSIPGGGVERGESLESAAKRELMEEMGIEIEVGKEVFVESSRFADHHIFLGKLVSGEPRFMTNSEEAILENRFNSYEVRWVEASELSDKNLRYYRGLADVIKQLAKQSRAEV